MAPDLQAARVAADVRRLLMDTSTVLLVMAFVGFCCARLLAWRAASLLRTEPSPAAQIIAIYARAFTLLTVAMFVVVLIVRLASH